MKKSLLISIAIILSFHLSVLAEAPTAINYQGLLTDGSGTPVGDGTYVVTFNIWDQPTGGISLWNEVQFVSTVDGFFAVLLGSNNPISDFVFHTSTRYLGIVLLGDPELSPRTALVSVPYAMRVSTVDNASGGNITSKVSIGPGHSLSGSSAAISGGSDNTANGDHSTVGGGNENTAVESYSTVGGGQSNIASNWFSTIGGGVGNTASGLYSTVPGGILNNAAGTYSFAAGRRAKALHSGSFVWADDQDADFESTGSNQFSIRARGKSNGLYGGFNVHGSVLLSPAAGDSQTVGIGGGPWDNSKLYITSELSTTLSTHNTAGGNAADFLGTVQVFGTLTKSSGSFKIDHPNDPENKYLYHSFVESPDMMNIYNGNIITDADGLATVLMPDYFDALNKDFRYQLTVIGTFSQAIVSSEIENGQFVIQTEKPNVKVSWQVTGVRQDEWANAHRIQTEVEKKPEERGLYIHPEVFGKSPEQGINWKNYQKPQQADNNQ